MSGTVTGGRKARDKNLARDPNWYSKIGKIGGKLGRTGGFASEYTGHDGLTGKERARVQGAIGGKLSKRGKSNG